MWVSILQNRRKKGKDHSVDKIKQYLKLTEKSSFSTSLAKSSSTFNSELKKSDNKEYSFHNERKQNDPPTDSRNSLKQKNSQSSVSILTNKTNLLNRPINNVSQVELSKRTSGRVVKEQLSSTFIIKKDEVNNPPKGALTGYLLQELSRKTKLKSQLSMNIHNTIFTFKEFMKAAILTPPKKPDTRLTPQKQSRKTIIFDMDQTLIHTNENITKNYQIRVPFRTIQGRIGYGFVEVRPHAKQILKRLSEHFDIFIFTASTKAYADPIIDHLDPGKVVQHRLYRQSCSLVKNQVFVKDLRVVGRRLENVLLVDNAPYSYMMQLANGVPILPYYKGKDDSQLLALEEYLMRMKEVDDVRKQNGEYFKLQEYIKFDSPERLVNKLYPDWLR